MKGFLITFEGAEGSGKSTQAEMLYEYLLSIKKKTVLLREPGGVPISEAIRKMLLDVRNTHMANTCEVLLYMAARAQLVEEFILPELKKGKIVLCDRFLDSTLVYQGYGHGIDLGLIKSIGAFATQNLAPDLTFVFDIEVQEGLARIRRNKDRIEKRALEYHERVRQGYLQLARDEPQRIKVIVVDGERNAIHQKVRKYIDIFLKA